MLSYHNDPAVKQKYISRFEAHRAADEVIQGTGFDNGRGCFVGCTLDNYDHSQFPVELGWPEWLAMLADTIFEGLPKLEAAQFGSDLLASVPVGVDLEPVKHRLTMHRMTRLIELQKSSLGNSGDAIDSVIYQVISSMEMVRRCAEAGLGKTHCDWSAARSAAASAASAARSAASAARSAESAADSAARSAAWSAAYQQERDALLATVRGLAA